VPLLTLWACEESKDYVELYKAEEKAPSFSESDIEAMKFMGATLVDQGANFAVYSENATRIELLLFDDPEKERPSRRYEMYRFGDVWNVYVEGVGEGQHYGFAAWGPNWEYKEDWRCGRLDGFVADVDADGNRFNPNKLLTDPYSIAVHRDHDWMKGSLASGPARAECTYAASSKSVITRSRYTWSEHEEGYREKRQDADWEGHRANELIVYEVHVKALTGDGREGVLHPRTFRGVGEMAGYLKDLGITAVELMPVMEKPLDGTYWGYNTLNFFVPEISLASKTDPLYEVIDEFKWMVDELHQNEIQVILDVVYNHTAEGGFWRDKAARDDVMLDSRSSLINVEAKEVTSIYNFRGFDNAAYYELEQDKAFFVNQTGVGNQTRCNHRPMRKLIIDNLRYWVEEMHVDGFRFDLATVLGLEDQNVGNFNPPNSVLQDIIDDPVLQKYNTRIIAEPWHLGHYHPGQFPASTTDPEVAWYEWNGKFRDLWRSFINYDEPKLNSQDGGVDLGGLLTGSQNLYGWNRQPYHSVNFITAHDGFTLYDLVSYNQKNNLCGPLNPICCSQPTNPFCDPTSGDDHNRSRDWGDELVKRQMIRNFFVALLISHGTPMLLGGDEWMRTQLGNNNAYSTSADNPNNWFEWGKWLPNAEKRRMHDFVRKLIAFRKAHAYAFAPSSYEEGASRFAWKDPGNNDMSNWDSRAIMLHYYDASAGPELAILINMDPGAEITFTLPEGRNWARILDTQLYFDSQESLDELGVPEGVSGNISLDEPLSIPDASYGVKSRTMVILEALP
jgi:glycogen operon protein